MNKYYSTIGLEIHAELSTKTKMFCGCKNNPDEKKTKYKYLSCMHGTPGGIASFK